VSELGTAVDQDDDVLEVPAEPEVGGPAVAERLELGRDETRCGDHLGRVPADVAGLRGRERGAVPAVGEAEEPIVSRMTSTRTPSTRHAQSVSAPRSSEKPRRRSSGTRRAS